jgi:hypothetical protein
VTQTPLFDAALAAPRATARPAAALVAAAAGGGHQDVVELAAELGITEVLHFTTSRGLAGILAQGENLSRRRLPEEKYVEHVARANNESRRVDLAWEPMVNLSITRVNDWMLNTSINKDRWRSEEVFWTVLSYEPSILGDAGVVFATTNNIYPACERALGSPGLASLYAPEVRGRYGAISTRHGLTLNQPTDRQAEVLYPGAVPNSAIQRIYVSEAEHRDEVQGWFSFLDLKDEPNIVVDPAVFR